MGTKDRFALLTVDTEALKRRAADHHVRRLIWGEHETGTAGIRELCQIGAEFGAKHVFFVDMCGAYDRLAEVQEAIRWLDQAGQDVQLHTHPETLPKSFWAKHKLAPVPRFMNQFTEVTRAEFVLRHFGKLLTDITSKPLLAHRAGSFRWNAATIEALRAMGVPLSFNQSMRAFQAGNCTHGEPECLPYVWSNGVVEVPVTERFVSPEAKQGRWVSLTYPESPYFRFGSRKPPVWRHPLPDRPAVTVFLLHSWSLLERDEQGLAVYRDDRLKEGYRQLLARVSKDYDIITAPEFLELYMRGKIDASRTVNLDQAKYAV